MRWAQRRRDETWVPGDGWTSEVSSGFALAGFLGLVFVALTLLAMEPLAKFDAYFNLAPPPPEWRPVLHQVDRIGQRAVALPILAAATYFLCRRRGSWRPAVVATGAVLAVNLVVGLLKVTLSRGAPAAADPSFFAGGLAYPSGHSANVILVYGLIAYLWIRYGDPGRRTRVVLWAVVALLSVVMVLTSLTLNWHWFTDLVGGLVLGGALLQLTVALDRAVPDPVPAAWRRELWQRSGASLRARWLGRSGGPADHA